MSLSNKCKLHLSRNFWVSFVHRTVSNTWNNSWHKISPQIFSFNFWIANTVCGSKYMWWFVLKFSSHLSHLASFLLHPGLSLMRFFMQLQVKIVPNYICVYIYICISVPCIFHLIYFRFLPILFHKELL